ncbi:M10 family metallopeptidase C-terminal domain-containing protein [Tateyamaria omphalii]|uniref:calcium-binding protein n=1 Tax=Tateyamaria omphalii TaxID=299262 RepID=UPI001C9A066F|nr:calcium-binding protein [Tateyamaria omphalii]MBY5935542.1 M10 family metallopeptidase C-terminal domain-containing protein [Tateyamaria omphalii]
MPDFLRTFISSTAETLDGSQSGLISANGGFYIDGSDAITATTGTNWLTNDGYIYAFDGGFSALDLNGTVFEMLNGEDGIITAENPTSGTIDADLSTVLDVVNHGLIHSSNGDAISFNDSDGSANFILTNTGSITANGAETIDSEVGTGYHYVFNSGLIESRNQVIELSGDLGASTFNTITNTGLIHSAESTGIGLTLGNLGSAYISNSGEISAHSLAIFSSSVRTTDVSVHNTGMIESRTGTGAIDLGSGEDLVLNEGTILGNVELGSAADIFDGRGGTVSGTVAGESGDDLYIIDDGSIELVETMGNGTDTVESEASYTLAQEIEVLTLLGSEDINGAGNGLDNTITGNDGANLLQGRVGNDTILGGGGDDTIGGGANRDSLEGGEGDDYINGGARNDTIRGDEGNDTLRGGLDNDVVSGGDGDDNIAGGLGNDTLTGNDGDDVLFGQGGNDVFNGGDGEDYIHGGAGNDTLSGANGDDTLVGGGGADTLTGGNGEDVFLFENFAQSRTTGGNFDTITDFQIGSDLIDLTALVEGTINFQGLGAVSANGEAELVIREPGGGPDSVVLVDVNGDGTQDFRINITGVTGLSETDFLL